MCNFFAAILMENGDLKYNKFTISHEDLIDEFNIKDNGNDGFVRLEYKPKGMPHELDNYELIIDENVKPEWVTDSVIENTKEKLKRVIQSMIITDSRKIIIGDAVILCGDAEIGKIKNSIVWYAYGDCQIYEAYDNCQVQNAYGNCEIHHAYGNCQVHNAYGNCQIHEAHGNCQVREAHGNCQVHEAYGNCQIHHAYGNCQIHNAYGNCQVHNAYGNCQIQKRNFKL